MAEINKMRCLMMACAVLEFDRVLKDMFKNTGSTEVHLVHQAYRLNFSDMFDNEFLEKERKNDQSANEFFDELKRRQREDYETNEQEADKFNETPVSWDD